VNAHLHVLKIRTVRTKIYTQKFTSTLFIYGNVRINLTVRRVPVTSVAVEKQ